MWGSRAPSKAYLERRERRKRWDSEFTMPSGHRGTSRRGKKGHFHLLDKYIRRIDALVPEDMEHLVRPLTFKPNQELTQQTLKLKFDQSVEQRQIEDVTEEEVREYFAPLKPVGVATNWISEMDGTTEIFVHFETNEETREARKKTLEPLGKDGIRPDVRFSDDKKWAKIMGQIPPPPRPFMWPRREWDPRGLKKQAMDAVQLEGGGSSEAVPEEAEVGSGGSEVAASADRAA